MALDADGLTPLRAARSNLKDEVAAHLREAIYSGRLRPGEKIDQDDIAAQLGVSKLPVREALIAVESEGLVRSIPRRGAFVDQLTPDDVRDHYRIYGLVSGVAAGRAALHLTDGQLAELDDVLRAMKKERSTARQEELNHLFHRTINVTGGSRRLRSIVRLLSNTLPERFYEFASGWRDIAIKEHERILKALRAHDSAEAERAMVDHISSGGEYAVQMLQDLGFWSETPGGDPA
jgi:DNA-binding GntR family transcriptional regulator